MNFPFYIARRYLFSKKSTHAINIISGVSIVGVAITTMALVVTLSVFNGFHDLVASFFTAFDPQLKITPAVGKTAPADDPLLTQVKQLPQIDIAMESVEDQALVVYNQHQAMVTIKGVEENFNQLTHIVEILEDGDTLLSNNAEKYRLRAADLYYGIIGMRIAEQLGMGYSYPGSMQVYAPVRQGQLNMADPSQGFVTDELYSPDALFCVRQGKYDGKYVLTHIDFARRLFDQQGQLSSLELRLKEGSNFDATKKQIQAIVGSKYKVQDRFEQQDDTFKIMKIEKLMAYLFLTFILIVASFNIIGSLSMLIIDKKDDVVTLRNLGASDRQITRIFLFEGRLISALGAVIGILVGLLLCWLQQTYGLVSLGRSSESFVINAYPVSVHPWDIVLVFVTVLAVGFLSVWYPVRYFAKRLLA